MMKPDGRAEAPWRHALGRHGFIERRGPVGILLIHGLTGTPAEMKPFAKRLVKAGYSVACPQLAGHCQSVEALKATHWRDWYGSVLIAFEQMKREYDQVYVGGLSMGALLALLLAAEKKEQVTGLILLSVTFFYDGWNIPRVKRRFLLPIALYTPLKHIMQWEEQPPYGIKCQRTRAKVAAVLSNKTANAPESIGYFQTPALVILESTRLIRAARRALGQVFVPTLIVHSTEDDMASIKNAHYVKRRISSKRVESFFVDDTYHVVTLDQRKDDIAARVAEFCASPAVG
jgi:carboxylesterase